MVVKLAFPPLVTNNNKKAGIAVWLYLWFATKQCTTVAVLKSL
jgi:hypothetical protein